jgi:hypothetical protein
MAVEGKILDPLQYLLEVGHMVIPVQTEDNHIIKIGTGKVTQSIYIGAGQPFVERSQVPPGARMASV